MASEANVTEIDNMGNGNASTIGGMPSQITHGMKRRLRDLGHTKAEIYEMTPGEAWALLNRSPSDIALTERGRSTEADFPELFGPPDEPIEAPTSPDNMVPFPKPTMRRPSESTAPPIWGPTEAKAAFQPWRRKLGEKDLLGIIQA